MAEFRQELYKKSGLNNTKERDIAFKRNRAQKKHVFFDSHRNGLENIDACPLQTSTPYHKKPPLNTALKERNEQNEDVVENSKTQHLSEAEEKVPRKKAYLQRFIAWKKEKQQQEALKKAAKKKPPFIPCGKPKKDNLQTVTLMKDVNFKDDSIYVAISTPRQKKPLETTEQKPKRAKALPPATKTLFRDDLPNCIASNKKNGIIDTNNKHKFQALESTEKRPKIAKSTPANKSLFKGSSLNIALETTEQKPKSAKAPPPATKTLFKDDLQNCNNNGVIDTNVTTELMEPQALESTEQRPKIAKATPATKSLFKGSSLNIALETTEQKPKSAKAPPPATKTLFKETLPSTIPDQQRENIKNNLVVVTAIKSGTNCTKVAKVLPANKTLPDKNEANKPTNILSKRVVVTSNVVKLNLKTKPSAPSNPDNIKVVSHTSNAVSKAKALNQKNMPSTKQPERAKLATSLKAKYRVGNSMATKMPNKKKIDVVGTLDNDEINNICTTTTISPTLISAKSKKRTITNQPQKNNFVRLLELETTIVESPRNKTLQAPSTIRGLAAVTKTKIPTPRVVVESPLSRPLLHLKNNPRKGFNFLKKFSLNETVEVGAEKTLTSNDEVDGAAKTSQLINEAPKRINTEEQPDDVAKELRNIDSPNHASNYLSPFVTCSRGKVSARKEREKRDSVYLPNTSGHIDLNDGTPKSSNTEISVEVRRAREAILYFRKQLSDEIQRLHTLCDNWQAYKDSNADMLELHGGNDMIDVAIGQTKLLTSKKFMQFNGLIDRCELQVNGKAPADDGSEKTKAITYVDLEGFWSMLGLQVENIEKRFENLERWKSNNWEDPDVKKSVEKPIRTKKVPLPNKIKPRANEALVNKMREMRAAMRQKRCKTESNSKPSEEEQQQQQLSTETLAQYFSPRRLRRSTLTKLEARRESLLATNSNNSTPNRIRIIVPDRRFHSIAPTVISVPSPPIRQVPSAKRSVTKTNGIGIFIEEATSPKRCTFNKPNSTPQPPRTPSPVNFENGYKPILKTPGTAQRQHNRVSFNVICSVQKFRKFGKHLEATEYDQVEEVHIDEIKSKFANESKPETSEETDEEIRTYRLRNRKVKLRPSSEFEIPK